MAESLWKQQKKLIQKPGANIKNYFAAFMDFTNAIKFFPKYAEAYAWRGNARINLFDTAGSCEDWSRAKALYNGIRLTDIYKHLCVDKGKTVTDYLNNGHLGMVVYNYREAIEEYNKAILLDSSYAAAYFDRGNARYELKEYKEACEDWEKSFVLGYKEAGEYLHKYCKKD